MSTAIGNDGQLMVHFVCHRE